MAESSLPLVIAGTLAVHLLVAVVVDVASVVGRKEDRPPPPRLSLVDLDTRAMTPPEPPQPPPVVEPEPAVAPPESPSIEPRVQTPSRRTAAPADTAPPAGDAPSDPGGGPVIQLPDIAPTAYGVAAAPGRPTTRRVGRGGGTGAGTGDGSGSGSGPAVVATSVASIKSPAEARAGFDYFDARKSYPAEARRLGVEGKIRVRLLVDATGKVAQARLLGGLGHGLDELALSRSRAIEFVPARDTDDRPVASVVIWTFTFTLPSEG